MAPRSLLVPTTILALLTNACSGRDEAAARAEDEAQARATVSRFFGAALVRDCDAVEAELGPALRQHFHDEGCEASLEDFRAHPLERIVSAVPDARSTDAILVRVRLEGRQTESVVRVEHLGASWRLVSM